MRSANRCYRTTLWGVGIFALGVASCFVVSADASSPSVGQLQPEVLQEKRVSAAAELQEALAANPLDFDKPSLHRMRCMTIDCPDKVRFVARFLKNDRGFILDGNWEHLFKEDCSETSAEEFAYVIAAASQVIGKALWLYGFGNYSRRGDRQKAHFEATINLLLRSGVAREDAVKWLRGDLGPCDENTIALLRSIAGQVSPGASAAIKDILTWWDGTASLDDYSRVIAAQPLRGVDYIAELYARRGHVEKLAELSSYLRKKVEAECADNTKKTDSRGWIGSRKMEAKQLFKLGYPEPALLLLKLCQEQKVFFSWWSSLLATMYQYTYDPNLPRHDFIMNFGVDDKGEDKAAIDSLVDYFVKSGFDKLKWDAVQRMWLAS